MFEYYICLAFVFIMWEMIGKITMKLFGWKFDSEPQSQEDYDREQRIRMEASRKQLRASLEDRL